MIVIQNDKFKTAKFKYEKTHLAKFEDDDEDEYENLRLLDNDIPISRRPPRNSSTSRELMVL